MDIRFNFIPTVAALHRNSQIQTKSMSYVSNKMASSCRITSGPTDPKHHRNSTVHSLTNPNLNLSEKHDDAIRNTKSEPKLPMMGLGG